MDTESLKQAIECSCYQIKHEVKESIKIELKKGVAPKHLEKTTFWHKNIKFLCQQKIIFTLCKKAEKQPLKFKLINLKNWLNGNTKRIIREDIGSFSAYIIKPKVVTLEGCDFIKGSSVIYINAFDDFVPFVEKYGRIVQSSEIKFKLRDFADTDIFIPINRITEFELILN